MIRNVYADRLFVGNAMDARDLRSLYDQRIAAVVDLAANEAPAQLGRDLIYVRFPLIDGDGNPSALIRSAISCVVTLAENDFRTLVACSAGMSRSPAIAAAAMAILTGSQPNECLATITSEAPHDVSSLLWSRVTVACDDLARRGS